MIEKLSKAQWVQDNLGDVPPKIHNINKLWQATQLTPTQSQTDTATQLNTYQLEGRYPDYIRWLYFTTTPISAKQLFVETEALRIWLLSTLL